MPINVANRAKQAPVRIHEPKGLLRTRKLQNLVNLVLLSPDISVENLAQALAVHRSTVSQWLKTEYVRSRIEAVFDARPYLYKLLKRNTLDASEYVGKIIRRGIEEADRKEPSPTVLQSATRSSLSTLQGTGILKDHVQLDSQTLDSKDLKALLDHASSLELSLRSALVQPDSDSDNP